MITVWNEVIPITVLVIVNSSMNFFLVLAWSLLQQAYCRTSRSDFSFYLRMELKFISSFSLFGDDKDIC